MFSNLTSVFGGGQAAKPGSQQQGQGAAGQKKPGPAVGGGSAIPYGGPSMQQPGFGATRPASGSGAGFGSGGFGPSGGGAPGATTRSGSGAGLPAASDGGGDLFGALNLKSGSSTSAAPAGGLLSGLNVAGSTGAPGAPQATGFNFMSSAAPAAAPAATGFDFLGGQGAAAPAAAAPSAFPFAAATAAVPAPAPAPAPSAALDTSASYDAAGGIRKKKGGFRPGFDRSAGEAGGPQAGAGQGGSMLSGLTVHEPGEGEAGEAPSLLAGMTVHADGTGVDESSSAGGGGLLAGMQLHAEGGASDAPAATGFGALLAGTASANASPRAEAAPSFSAVPVSSGFSFASAGVSSSAATPAPATTAGSAGKATTTSSTTKGASFLTDAMPYTSAAAASAPAPASADPTARKKAHVAALHEAARSTRLRLADVKIRLRSLAEEDKAAGAEVERLRAKVGEIEAAQDEAVRTEAFDDAERLAEQLESVRGSLTVAESKREAVRARRRRAEEEQEAALADQLAVANDCLAGLKSYEQDRTTALSSFLREATTRHVSGSERIKGEEEQLRLKEEHVARESVLVGEEEQQVERAISEQTEELNRSVAELRDRHARLTDEVAELERLLEAKRREQRQASSQLSDAEARIATIRGKFDKQAKRLQAKRAAVAVEQEECTNEAAAIAKAKKEYSTAKAKDRAAERALLRQAGHAGQDVGVLEELRAALLAQEGKRKGLTAQAAGAAAAVATAGEEVEKAARSLRAVHAKKAALEGQAAAARKLIDSIDGKIPGLNEEKKAAVAGKKFKEAARVNDELKRLADQREQAERELSEATSGIDSADQEATVADGALAKAKAGLEGVKKDADLARVALLTDAVKTAATALRRVARRLPAVPVRAQVAQVDNVTLESLEQQDDSGEPGDEELGIEVDAASKHSAAQSAAQELLVAQRDALMEELTALAVKHGVAVDVSLPPLAAEEEGHGHGHGQEEEAHDHSSSEAGAGGASGASAAHAAHEEEEAAPAPVPAVSSLLAGLQVAEEGLASSTSAGTSSSWAASSADVPAVTSLPFLAAAAATEPEAVPAVSGFAALLGGASAAAEAAPVASALPFLAAAAEPEPAPTAPSYTAEALAAARVSRLKRCAAAVASVASAVSEKESLISEAVGREEFDVADSLQADIDDMLGHRSFLLGQAQGLGVGSEEELLGSYLGVEVDEALAATVPDDVDVMTAVAAAPAAPGSPQAAPVAATGFGLGGIGGFPSSFGIEGMPEAAGTGAEEGTTPSASAFPFGAGGAAADAATSSLSFLSGGAGSAGEASGSGGDVSGASGSPAAGEAGAAGDGAAPVATGFSFM